MIVNFENPPAKKSKQILRAFAKITFRYQRKFMTTGITGVIKQFLDFLSIPIIIPLDMFKCRSRREWTRVANSILRFAIGTDKTLSGPNRVSDRS